MPNSLIKSALGAALGFLLINPAVATPLTPPTTVTGTFLFDNDVEEFEFSIDTTSLVTLETISYSGGVFASNALINSPAGGFDPYLWLFDDTGALIADADDGRPVPDPVNGLSFDTFLQPVLDPGVYTVAITQFGNFFNGGIGDDISLGFTQDGAPNNFTSLFGCSNGQFCEAFAASPDNNRTGFFAVNVSTEPLAVPEPSTLALVGFGLIGAGMAYRRRQQR